MEVSQHPFRSSSSIHVVTRQDDAYDAVCHFVHDQYRHHFDCDLKQFMPSHLVLFQDNEILAVAGFRAADTEPLFLEQYLDVPIETFIDSRLGRAPGREKIVEVGGFAAKDHSSALQLMLALSLKLYDLGFECLVCAANSPIRRCLKLSGFIWEVLGEVDPSRVDARANNWGRYYQSRPQLLAGVIPQNNAQLKARTQARATLGAVV